MFKFLVCEINHYGGESGSEAVKAKSAAKAFAKADITNHIYPDAAYEDMIIDFGHGVHYYETEDASFIITKLS